MFDNLAASAPLIKDGKVKALAVTTAGRSSLLPEVPTVEESGVKGFDLGTWFGGYEGAPDKFLSFFFDGTYRFSVEPYDKPDQKEKVFTGEYDVSGSRLTLEIPGKGRVSARIAREKADKGPNSGHTLVLEGDVPESFKGKYRDWM